MEEKIAVVEEEMEKKVEWKIERNREVARNFSFVSQEVEDFKKKLLPFENKKNEGKFVHVPVSPVPVKLSISADRNADAPLRRPCLENSKYCSKIKKKFNMIDPEVHQVTALSTSESLPRSYEGNNILIVMDYFIKWPEAYILHSRARVLDCCLDSCATLDLTTKVPLLLHSDQGRNFDSAVC
ncbi:hypothetical protein TNCV_1891141 [Trichonephila clavipes]|nr:hypothetical protein TNCV_1891141 [Trichonephila clavipes]